MYYCQQSFLHVREPSKIYSYFHIHIFLVVVFYSNKILASFIQTYKTKQKRPTLNIQDHMQPSWGKNLSSGYYSEFSWDNDPKSLLSTLHCRVDGKLRSQTSSTMDVDNILFFLWSLTITSTAWHFQLPWKKRRVIHSSVPSKTAQWHWFRQSRSTLAQENHIRTLLYWLNSQKLPLQRLCVPVSPHMCELTFFKHVYGKKVHWNIKKET